MTQPTQRVQLSGVIRESGVFTFGRANPPPPRTPNQLPRSPFQFEVVDASGKTIELIQATVRQRPACHPTELHVGGTVTLTDSADTVRLTEFGRTLWEHRVGDPPAVRASLEGTPSRERGVTLAASYDVADEPTYLRVALRRDAGVPDVVLLPTAPLASSVHVDLGAAPGGAARLVVTIGSGVRWASTLTGPFRLPSLGRYLALHSPVDGTRLAPGQSIRLSAGLINLDEPDEPASGRGVQWLVDDELVAEGLAAATPRLVPGEHTITVRVADDETLTRSAIVVVAADDAPRRKPRSSPRR
jgi:hypothetical protein